ncbi:MAG: AAA family ATPase, partial [Firmicutes bacterium]|nr:AAA family ATPase [Bacillota bacterium]
MGNVKFDRVRLTGFGPYRETTEFVFTDRLNVFVAPNESGKSTLVAGITALLFGLPQTTDPTVFGQARYLNWDHPLGFEGELVWRVDEDSYRLRRNFQNNQISLARLENGEYREIIGGTHNPRAQRRNRRYEEKLQELIGLNAQDLFEATFCLTQPLPEADELDSRVQELLSGTGVGFKEAADRLAEELRKFTRFTGRRGVTPRDAIEPRRLEQLAAEIETTRAVIDRDRAQVDQLEAVRKRLAEKENDRVKQEEKLAAQERILTLWGQWQHLKQQYEAARQVYTQVQKSREQARELEATLSRLEEEKAAYPWGPAVPAETAAILGELEATVQQKIRIKQGIAELEAESHGGLAADEGAAVTPTGPDWSALGPQPAAVVARRGEQAAEALTLWAEWEQLEAAAAENRRIRTAEYPLFEEADPDLVETLKGYESRRAYLRSELENATLKWENAKAELRRLERRRYLRLVMVLGAAAAGGWLAALWAGGRAGLPLWLS